MKAAFARFEESVMLDKQNVTNRKYELEAQLRTAHARLVELSAEPGKPTHIKDL